MQGLTAPNSEIGVGDTRCNGQMATQRRHLLTEYEACIERRDAWVVDIDSNVADVELALFVGAGHLRGGLSRVAARKGLDDSNIQGSSRMSRGRTFLFKQ